MSYAILANSYTTTSSSSSLMLEGVQVYTQFALGEMVRLSDGCRLTMVDGLSFHTSFSDGRSVWFNDHALNEIKQRYMM